VCAQGYEFRAQDGSVLSEEDGPDDCQPVVLARCATGYTRNAQGVCVEAALICLDDCVDGAGKYSVSLGFCVCDDLKMLEDVCNDSCQSSAAKLTYRDEGVCVDGTNCLAVDGINAVKVSVNCPSGDCPVISLTVANGVGGSFGRTSGITDLQTVQTRLLDAGKARTATLLRVGNAKNHLRSYSTLARKRTTHPDLEGMNLYKGAIEQEEIWKEFRSERRRRLLAVQSTPTVNPAIICAKANKDVLLFDLSSSDGYMIYDKENLWNSNPDFDNGAFLDVQESVTHNSTVEMFAYTFPSEGTYVFSESGAPTKKTVFKVIKETEVCPSASSILPLTASNMVLLGITKRSNIVVSPDWSLIGTMCVLLVALFGTAVAGVYYFQNRAWSLSQKQLVQYKNEALTNSLDIWQYNSKGSVLKMDSLTGGIKSIGGGKSAKGGKADDGVMIQELDTSLGLEGFDFHSLYQMMEDQQTDFAAYFEHQQGEMRSFYDRMTTETDHLKQVLAVKMHVQLNRSGEGFEDAVERLVGGEIKAREAYEDSTRVSEAEMQQLLEELVVAIASVGDDYFVQHVKKLTRLVIESIGQASRGLRLERERRRVFSAHVEIVGERIVEALEAADRVEAGVLDDYIGALEFFRDRVDVILDNMLELERTHLKNKEKLADARPEVQQREVDVFHRDLLRLVKDIRGQIGFFEQRLAPIFIRLKELEDKTEHTRGVVTGILLEERLDEVRSPIEGYMFRGINPELAK
jgi:hypothetical protein